jgi:hypothetical protein
MKRFVPFLLMVTMLAACTTVAPIATEPELTAIATTIPAPSMEEITSRVSAVVPVTIYSGPGSDYLQTDILESGATARLLETREGGWMNIECPQGITVSCWISWEMNAIHSYEGPPITLNIPDPASLKIESMNRRTSPDGRYLYSTSLFDVHGACVSMNIGESLDRLDLSDGTVATLRPPHAFRLLSISPDEKRITYLGGQNIINYTGHQSLIVRDLESAYDEGADGQESILWQSRLELEWPTAVSEISWSPDSSKLLVTATTLADVVLNTKTSTITWELNMETGELVESSSSVIPTSTP